MSAPDRSAARSTPSPPLRVGTPGELVAAVPALIGFHPNESLVVIGTGGASGRRIGLTLRVDLPPPEHVIELAAVVVDSLFADTPSGAAVIVIADGPEGAPPAADLVDLVVTRLEAREVDVHTVLWASGTAGGSHWRCYDACACAGTVPDPATTATMAAAVAGGQVVLPDRAALVGRVAPADPGRIRRREERLVALLDAAEEAVDVGAERAAEGGTRSAAGSAGGGLGDSGSGVALLDEAVAEAAAGRLALDDDRVVALATALGLPDVRRAALRHCMGPRTRAAEELWAALTRETPDPEAAEPAALLAVSALLRGDGALANVALERADRAWPGHRFTRTVHSMLARRIRPDVLLAHLEDWLTDVPGRAGSGRRGRKRNGGRRSSRRAR